MQVEKIPISTPRMVIGNSKGVVGFNCQSFEGKYEAKLEIPARRGRGSKNYITLVEVWIFSGTPQSTPQSFSHLLQSLICYHLMLHLTEIYLLHM